MTEQDQIKALAELDGFIHISTSGPFNTLTGIKIIEGEDRELRIPNYLHYYDAIIPLVQKQSLEIRDRIATKGGPLSFMVTPAALAERLLRATGKWKD